MSKLIISIDLNTLRLTRKMLERIVYDLSCEYSIVNITLYNYTPLKDTDIGNIRNVVYIPVQSSRRKVMIDMRQAADIIEAACRNDISAIFVICGMLDSEAIFAKATALNKTIIIGTTAKLSLPFKQYIIERHLNIMEDIEDCSAKKVITPSPKPNIPTQAKRIISSPAKTIISTQPTEPNSIAQLSNNVDLDIDAQLQEINNMLNSLA